MNVWRIYFKDDLNDRTKYCLDNNLAAMGWSLRSLPQIERENIKTYGDWENVAAKEYKPSSRSSVKRLANEVKTGDIVWCRKEGKYYIARVDEDSRWFFNAGKQATDLDASNQIINLRWKKISEFSDEISVPGAISTAFIRGSAFQRIKKDGVAEFSKICYNSVVQNKVYQDDLKLTRSVFYNMLQPSDVEDLLCMWLYSEYGYICVPSTNKLATPLYECVLVDPKAKGQKHVYIQVKKGKTNLYASNYRELNGEVFLLTTEGKVEYDDGPADNIKVVDPDLLYEFALNDDKYSSIIPENVQIWLKFIAGRQNEKIENTNTVKGIMFDTNRSYSDNNEREMIEGGYVAAYGEAKRYAKRFNKNDYVLYYAKGKGVFAVGKIIAEETEAAEDSLRRKVEIVAPEKLPENVDLYKYVSAKEIRKVLKCSFYFRSTIKVPYLTELQTLQIIESLNKKYETEK